MKYHTKLPMLLLPIFSLIIACSSSSQVREGSQSQFTSKYHHTDTQIEGFNILKHTKAPLRVVVMARVDLPPSQTFKLMAVDLPKWNKSIQSVKWNHALSSGGTYGTGSVRLCSAEDDLLVEKIVHWTQDRFFAFKIDFKKTTLSTPIKNQLATVLIENDGKSGSLVTWRSYYDKKFHPMSLVFTWYLRSKIMEAGLKNIVEQHGGEMIQPNFN